MSFFPIYLEEQLRYAPVAIAGMAAVGQAFSMAAVLLGGGFSDSLGSKWVLVFGLLGGVVASLIFQSGVPLMVAALWGLAGASGSLQTLGGSSYLARDGRSATAGSPGGAVCAQRHAGDGALGSPVAGRILDTAGYRAYGLVGLGLAALTVLLAVILLPNRQRQTHDQAAGPRPRKHVGHDQAAGDAAADGPALLAHDLLRHVDRPHPADDQPPGRQQDHGGPLRAPSASSSHPLRNC